jgi:hypothetical protein
MPPALMLRLTALAALTSIVPIAAYAPAPAPNLAPRDLLRSIGQFTDADWAAVERGESVARLLETGTRDIAVAGAVRISGSPHALVERYRDIDGFKKSSLVLDAQRMSVPPVRTDLDRMPLDEYSLDLRSCRPGDCQVRLAAGDVRRFQRDINWYSPHWRRDSSNLWRDVLMSYVLAYGSSGRRALPVFVNREPPVSVPDELSILVREYGFLAAYAPEFHAYLQEFGPRIPEGAEQTLYWTKEDIGVRPIVRISHQVTHRAPGSNLAAIIVTNQVYADHYLDAALSVTLALADGSGRGFYMIAVNRARTRSLTGILRRFARSTVQNRSRDGLRKILTNTKTAIERPG